MRVFFREKEKLFSIYRNIKLPAITRSLRTRALTEFRLLIFELQPLNFETYIAHVFYEITVWKRLIRKLPQSHRPLFPLYSSECSAGHFSAPITDYIVVKKVYLSEIERTRSYYTLRQITDNLSFIRFLW